MSKRMRELAEQAGFQYIKDEGIGWAGNYNDSLPKFAELIVRECIGCCEQVISDPVPNYIDTWLNGGSQCIDEIKQHFGVER